MNDTNDEFDWDDPADDENEAAERILRRMVVASMSGPTMRTFAAAVGLLLSGRHGAEFYAPEPIIQVGFEPDEDEMNLIADFATAKGRDVIHVSCADDGSGTPTGMIAVAFLEHGRARGHRRGGLLCAPGTTTVHLAGVSDDEDEICHFVLSHGRKMTRASGYPVGDIVPAMRRGLELIFNRARTLNPADCTNEALHIPGVHPKPWEIELGS